MDTSRNAHARLKKLEKLLYYAELAQVWRAGRDLARGFGIIFEGQLFAGDPRDLVAETGYAVSLEEIAAALEMELRELKARILQWAASFGFYVYGVEVRLNRVTTSAFLKGLLHELAEIPAEAHPTGTLTDGESRARLKKLKEVLLAAERRHRPIWKRQVGNDHLLDVLKISGKKNILDFHSFPVSLGEIAAALEVGEGELSGRISRVARPGFHFPSFQLAELGFPLVGGNVWMTPEVSGEFLSNLLYELAPSGEISHAGNLGESLCEYHGVLLYRGDYTSVIDIDKVMGKTLPLLESSYSDGNKPAKNFGFTPVNGHVEVLFLEHQGFSSLPDIIGNLGSLRRLFITGNALTSLPSSIGSLSSLEVLTAGDNQLVSLPPSIGNLKSLKQLDLIHNALVTLPPSIGNLKSLTRLGLDLNALETLPPEVGQLQSLRILNVSYNQLISLPAEVGELNQLEELGAARNLLAELPANLGKLKHLRFLQLDNNKLESLPKTLQTLPALQRVEVTHNPLTRLSESMMKWIEKINANPYPPEDDPFKPTS